MNTYLTIFSVALVATLILTPLWRRLCQRRGWVDDPTKDDRRVHQQALPRLGGVAICASVLLALAALPLLDTLVTDAVVEKGRDLLAVAVPVALIFLFGIYDDLRGAPARQKFMVQALAGTLFFALGGRIEALTLPFVGSVEVPLVLSFALTVFWLVAISNAFNLIDGMDGLATGSALFASLVMLVVALLHGDALVIVLTLALSGALIGFLRYNFNPASIFLGDCGALSIGFLLAALSVQGAQKASTAVAVAIPLLSFGLPVVDTGFTIVRRFISGRPLFEGDREHIHHKLLERGWTQRRVALVLYTVCAVFGLAALFFAGGATERGLALVLGILGVSVILAIGRLRYHELDEVGSSMRRNLVERRARAANHLRVRRACRALARASTLDELLGAVGTMLESGEFIHATVHLGRGGDSATSQRVLERMNGLRSQLGVEERAGIIRWSWERPGAPEITNSDELWSVRLPLSTPNAGWGYINLYRELESKALLLDINYLCSLFHREMSEAVERIFLACEKEEEPVALSAMEAASGD